MMEEPSDIPIPCVPSEEPKELRICLVGDVADDPEIIEAAEIMKTSLKAQVIEVENSLEAIDATMIAKWLNFNCMTLFVLKNFIGPVFQRIQEYDIKKNIIDGGTIGVRKSRDDDIKWILGPPAFKQIAKMPYDLSFKKHPLYNYSMAGIVTCFTGIRDKTELTELVNKIHFMGGCIRRNMDSKSTHLITRYSSGKKYMYAKTFRLTVVRPEWVDAAWDQRDVGIAATDDTFTHEYKLGLFEGLKICFFGFPEEEHQHMIDVLKTHGGISTELDDPQCSHVVMPNMGFLKRMESKYEKTKPSVVSDVDVDVDDPNAAAGAGAGAATAATAATATACDASNAMDIVECGNDVHAQKEVESKCLKDKSTSTMKTKNEQKISKENDSDNEIEEEDTDGIVMTTEEDEKKFQLDISYISPILANDDHAEEDDEDDDDDGCENLYDDDDDDVQLSELVSMTPEVKPNFLRTKSLARKIGYSFNLVANSAPFLRSRKQNSECIDPNRSNVNLSIGDGGGGGITPKRILRPHRYLAKKDVINTESSSSSCISSWRGKFLTPTQPIADKKKRSRRQSSRDTSGTSDLNETTQSTTNMVVNIGENTPKSTRRLRSQRNLTISGLPSSLAHKRNFFNDTFEKITQKTNKKKIQIPDEILNKSIKNNQTKYADEADDFDIDMNDTQMTSSMSQSIMSKKQKSFALTESAGKSVKHTIRRSIHYVSEKTPLSRILRRRSSITSQDFGCGTMKNSIERPHKRPRMEEEEEEQVEEENVEEEGTICAGTSTGTAVGGCSEFKTPKIPIPKVFSHSSAHKVAVATVAAATTTAAAATITTVTTTISTSTKTTETLSAVSVVDCSSKLSDPNHLNANPKQSSASSSIKMLAQENMHATQNHVGILVSSSSQVTSETARVTSLYSLKRSGGSEMVVDEHSTQVKINPTNLDTQVLKSDWFWYTIQNGYADEKLYRFSDYLESIANTPDTDRRESLPISLNKRKRKRFSQRLQFEGSPLGIGKRRSSISDAVYSSFSDSFLDCTTSPDTSKIYAGEQKSSVLESRTPGKKSLRFLHFMDFLNTESNYVGILDTIMKLFKIPLEELADRDDALLNNTEINLIFGKFYSIHEVHQRMLERLIDLQSKWTEDCLIGDIILDLKDELIKSYPPYINSFETMKDTLSQCDKDNPRFHAFLKINQTKPECGRQSLQDLMIRPVQRLPSISLLLNDILKHTDKANPDYIKLEESLKAIREVMTYINEDKRKTESRVAIFDIFNDIEGCPAHLVSSNRDFISKCEVIELSEELSGRGDALTFYLFSDTIEVCKKRSRGFNSAKSPGSIKMFKHVKLLPLNAIRFVIDITDSPRAFALLCGQDKEKFYAFNIEDEVVDKIVYIKTLCKQMAEHACRANLEKSLLLRTSQELNVDISNINLSTLHKAFKLAARTRIKVGRAFSFNKTPSKLKRAVSTMMTSPFGSTNALTPASQLAQMRLASCTNIHEATGEDDSIDNISRPMELEPPLSVQPERKHKSSTLNSLGRL